MGRLRAVPADQDAWRDFVDIYGGPILHWAKNWGLQDADAEDVTQATLLRLARAMRDFAYDPKLSFRGWLRTVAHHAWQDLARVRRPILLGDDNPLLDRAANVGLATAVESAFGEELLRKAMISVRLRVEPQTWEAFRLTALEQYSGAEAAAQLDMRMTSVYKARSNVQKMLQAEVRLLEEECDAAPVPS
jgi:RNA polymerase sigma-70 factor (ECF subfamily)